MSNNDQREKQTTSLRLDLKVLKEFQLLAIEQDVSIHAIVESLVTEYIQQYKAKK